MSGAMNTPPVEELQGEQTETENQNSEVLAPDEASDQEQQVASESVSTDGDEASTEGTDSSKKPSGIERRFKKFQTALEQQAQELEYWKKVALEKGTSPKQEPVQAAKPLSITDFDSVEDYIAAREQQLKDQLIQELEQVTTARAQQQAVVSSYLQKVNEAKAEYADWDEVMVVAGDEPTTPETVNFCLESPVGPKIAYYLAKNPEVNEKLNGLSPARRLAELGKLEDRLSTKASNNMQQKPVTKAPAKMAEVKGSDAPRVPVNSGEAKSFAEWKAARERANAAKKR